MNPNYLLILSFLIASNVTANVPDEADLPLPSHETSSLSTVYEPLDPSQYFPLGSGVRKKGRAALVPFCVSVHATHGTCTEVQFFELSGKPLSETDQLLDLPSKNPSKPGEIYFKGFIAKPVGSRLPAIISAS